MPRPMKLNREIALESAMNQFWHTGYGMNSVNALSKHLGITRSSFYNTFSSREQLFREAMERYVTDPQNSGLFLISTEKPFKPEVERVFRALCKTRASDNQHRGCLLVNSLAELSSQEGDADLVDFMDTIVNQSRALLSNRIVLAQKAGELASSQDADKLALSLQNLSYGTNVMSKVVHSEQELWDSCALMLEGLGLLDS